MTEKEKLVLALEFIVAELVKYSFVSEEVIDMANKALRLAKQPEAKSKHKPNGRNRHRKD